MKHLIELHMHLDGSLRAETMWELAMEQGLELEEKSIEEVRSKMEVPEDCKTLEEYLERFALPTKVLQTEHAIERVAFDMVETLAKEGVTYAEVRFAPQLHTQKGLTQAQVVEAAIRGTKLGMEQYPGIRVTLNSDNMTCSRVNIHSELDILRTVFGFTEEEIETIMQYAYEARFLKDYINEQ